MVRSEIEIGSGNFDLPEIMLRGPDVWNQWRKDNPDADRKLSKVGLSGADLSGANLNTVNLS